MPACDGDAMSVMVPDKQTPQVNMELLQPLQRAIQAGISDSTEPTSGRHS